MEQILTAIQGIQNEVKEMKEDMNKRFDIVGKDIIEIKQDFD